MMNKHHNIIFELLELFLNRKKPPTNQKTSFTLIDIDIYINDKDGKRKH